MWRAAMLVLIVLPFVAASGAAQPPAPQGPGAASAVPEWTEYQNVQDGFKVVFPGQPKITETTWASEYGYKLPARTYTAERGRERYSVMVVDYSPIEQQGMARYNGIFVCTTNQMDRIDQAALRRFTFKIRFKPLTAVQREKMFVTEALAGDAELLTSETKARLAKLDQLCPGDFAAVKRQVDILDAEFTVAEFLEQLEAEHRIKPEVREARNIGFMQ